MSTLAKFPKLMFEYQITEEDIFNYKEQQRTEKFLTHMIYSRRSQKWGYRVAVLKSEITEQSSLTKGIRGSAINKVISLLKYFWYSKKLLCNPHREVI